MTKWYLWTPFTLIKADQNWIDDLRSNYSFRIELLTDSDIEAYFLGDLVELRESYFGELVLTRESIHRTFEHSVAPVRARWIEAVHQEVDVESDVRQYLGESSSFENLHTEVEELNQEINELSEALNDEVYSDFHPEISLILNYSDTYTHLCKSLADNVGSDDIDEVQAVHESWANGDKLRLHKSLNQLRKRNLSLSLSFTNALSTLSGIRSNLFLMLDKHRKSFIAVLADAGGGKTHLAISIASQNESRSAGVFLQGRDLRKGMTLDGLSERVNLGTTRVSNFNEIVVALDAFAYRQNCRLPIVIDGLNEAEDPRDWKALLSTAISVLREYPNVLLVVTLRTGEASSNYTRTEAREKFAQMALPDGASRLISSGFGSLTLEAINSYFDYYKISADILTAPNGFFNHPLNLRIFCDVTNSPRDETVNVATFPTSLSVLFSQYMEHIVENICDLPNFNPRYTPDEVEVGLFNFGLLLWEHGGRDVPESEFLQNISQVDTSWERSLPNRKRLSNDLLDTVRQQLLHIVITLRIG